MKKKQEIKHIAVKDLVLWTENPRDPISSNSSDQDIADRAIEKDSRKRWSLKGLFSKMGDGYDFSELPTIVYKKGKPIVYDGNRRVLIGKIIHEYVSGFDTSKYQNFDFPEKIPCNVCNKQTALRNVLRKHAGKGSWDALERDIFLYKHMGEDKSLFLKFEEATKLISSYKKLNQGFVKSEVLTEENLNTLGFFETKSHLTTTHKKEIAEKILSAIAEAIIEKQITTRNNRGDILGILRSTTDIKEIKQDWSKSKSQKKPFSKKIKPTKRVPKKKHKLFGGNKSPIEDGEIGNLYLDLHEMEKMIGKKDVSDSFPCFIRMGLRLLAEAAGKDKDSKDKKPNDCMKGYVQKHFEDAKNRLTHDEQKTLHIQNIHTSKECIDLLQASAHSYTANNNYEQTIALSLLIGKMLEISHGKKS